MSSIKDNPQKEVVLSEDSDFQSRVKRFARMSQLPESGVLKMSEEMRDTFEEVLHAYDVINGFERNILEMYDVPRHYSTVMSRKFHITGIYALCLLEEMGKTKEEIKRMKLATFIMCVEKALKEMGYYEERKEREQ